MPAALTLLVALALNADAPPQAVLYQATVKVPEALVRKICIENPLATYPRLQETTPAKEMTR